MNEECWNRIEEKLDALKTKVDETHTALFTRGGAFDRLDAVEKKTDATHSEMGVIKTKVAAAAAVISAVVGIAIAKISKWFN